MGLLMLVIAVLWASTGVAQVATIDETIPAPTMVTAEPFDGDGDLGSGLLFRWPSVPGVSGYRIWRQIIVDYQLDASGELVLLDQPEGH